MAAAIGAPEVCGWCCNYCEGRAGDAEGMEGPGPRGGRAWSRQEREEMGSAMAMPWEKEEEDGSDGWGPLSAEKRGRRKGYFGQY